MLGKFGKMMEDANESIKKSQEMQKKAEADQQAAAQPVDMQDPMWEPIEGITLDKYAEITALLGKNNVMGVEAVNAFAESKGVKPGTWQVVQNGWVARMGKNEPVRTRYGILYNEFMNT
ncbi:hypothetical protein JXM67_01910 [candidate division WOR-3 bacterium]|nr:hypothetical protein [candidate division WOR-3 bacterium]